MRINKILAKMRAGEKAYGCMLIFPSAEIIELLGLVGFDYVMLDGEHGAFSPETIGEMCRAADAAGLTPIARVYDVGEPIILRFLDRGIMGIMGPHISTADRARTLVNACRFAPQGKRSFGSSRGNLFGDVSSRNQFMERINQEILVIAQLEDVEAMEDLPGILKVEGIDLFTYGPNDLAQSMGFVGNPDHPKVQKAMEKATAQIHAAGKKMMSDIMVAARATNLILDSAREFLKGAKVSA